MVQTYKPQEEKKKFEEQIGQLTQEGKKYEKIKGQIVSRVVDLKHIGGATAVAADRREELFLGVIRTLGGEFDVLKPALEANEKPESKKVVDMAKTTYV